MTKAIIFDVGGVLVEINGLHIVRAAKYLGISPQDIDSKRWKKVYSPLSRGVITEKEFYKRLCLIFNKKIKKPPQKSIFSLGEKDFPMIKENMELVKKLKENYKLAVLSNTIPIHSQILQERKLYEPFDTVLLSHEIGARKPEKSAFRFALEALEVDPEETVFIDDLQENVEAADSMGIKTVLCDNPYKVKEKLQELGLKL